MNIFCWRSEKSHPHPPPSLILAVPPVVVHTGGYLYHHHIKQQRESQAGRQTDKTGALTERTRKQAWRTAPMPSTQRCPAASGRGSATGKAARWTRPGGQKPRWCSRIFAREGLAEFREARLRRGGGRSQRLRSLGSAGRAYRTGEGGRSTSLSEVSSSQGAARRAAALAAAVGVT